MRLTVLGSCLLTLLNSACIKAPPEFCTAWPASGTAPASPALNRAVDAFARSLDPRRPLRDNARALADWLRQQPCVAQVGVGTEVIATEPPGLDLTVVHRNGTRRTFSVLFGKDRVQLSNSY